MAFNKTQTRNRSKMRPLRPFLAAGIAVVGAALLLIALASPQPAPAAPQMSRVPRVPELAAGTWANGQPTTLAAQKGKVVLLAFWTHQCINCRHTLPYWKTWANRYNGDVQVISVHTPELPSEREIANVRRAVRDEGINFPVVTDNDFATWKRFNIQAWPTTILIDRRGREAARWEGELNWNNAGTYHEVEATIERLRKDK